MLKPLGDKALLRAVTVEDSTAKTASGIIVPDSAKTVDQQRIVVALGPDIKNKTIKVGDKVVLTSMMMKEVYEEGDDKYEIVKETDILGIL